MSTLRYRLEKQINKNKFGMKLRKYMKQVNPERQEIQIKIFFKD